MAYLFRQTAWECRPGGSDSNGGGFNGSTFTLGTDYSQQNAAHETYTDLVISVIDNNYLTSAAHPFAADDFGNVLRITGGSGWTPGFYVIVNVAGVIAQVDKIDGTTDPPATFPATGGEAVLGGAFASPAFAAATKVAGNDVFCYSGDGVFPITSATQNVTGGCVYDNTGGTSADNFSQWVGYNTHRVYGNTDAPAVLEADGVISAFTLLTLGTVVAAWNFKVDGNDGTSSIGATIADSYSKLERITATRCTTAGIDMGGGNSTWGFQLEAYDCSGTAGIKVAGNRVFDCYSHNNACSGFLMEPNSVALCCVSASNSGGTSDGFENASVGYNAVCCVAYGNERWGFNLTGNAGLGVLLVNCLSEANGDEGFGTDGVKDGCHLFNCGGFDNGGAGNYTVANLPNVFSFLAGSATFFTNGGAGDFSLNNTSGGGAGARASGYPGAFPGGITGHLDRGAVQHLDSGGGGSMTSVPFIGLMG